MEIKQFPRKLTRDATDRLLIQAADDSVQHVEAADFLEGISGGGGAWQIVTNNFAAQAPCRLWIQGAQIISLPLNPSNGDLIEIAGDSKFQILGAELFNGRVNSGGILRVQKVLEESKLLFISGLGWVQLAGSLYPANSIFSFSSGGDENGIAYFLGTNFGREIWTNPSIRFPSFLSVSSSLNGFPARETLTDRSPGAWHSNLGANQWIAFDFGSGNDFSLTCLTLRNRFDTTSSAGGNFVIEGSNDGTIFTQMAAASLPNTANFWNVVIVANSSFFRVIRIRKTNNDYFTAGEIEMYGVFRRG